MAREQHLQLLTPSSKDLRAVAINRNNSLNANSLEEIVLEKEEKVQTKVIIRFRAVGDAPILKKIKYKVTAEDDFKTIIIFLRSLLKCSSSETLFLYINQAFSPSPDEPIKNLFEMFAKDNKLDIFYCKSPAWG
ncbi:uncharacterized protein LOC135120035 [Zophobas morio]|uniref:uncharacterized protein LOC135120035 n=1 Tax=Zophobas morio TaxID=2755281 RepID=UPI003082727E